MTFVENIDVEHESAAADSVRSRFRWDLLYKLAPLWTFELTPGNWFQTGSTGLTSVHNTSGGSVLVYVFHKHGTVTFLCRLHPGLNFSFSQFSFVTSKSVATLWCDVMSHDQMWHLMTWDVMTSSDMMLNMSEHEREWWCHHLSCDNVRNDEMRWKVTSYDVCLRLVLWSMLVQNEQQEESWCLMMSSKWCHVSQSGEIWWNLTHYGVKNF